MTVKVILHRFYSCVPIHYRLKLNILSEDLIVNVLCAITRGASANNVKQINKKLEFNFFLATAALSQWLQVILFFRRYITMCKSVEWILLALFPLLNVAVFFRPPRTAKTMFLPPLNSEHSIFGFWRNNYSWHKFCDSLVSLWYTRTSISARFAFCSSIVYPPFCIGFILKRQPGPRTI